MLKLGCFGLVTEADYYSVRMMKHRGIHYFAPEVLYGEYSMKSDVWSFGILLIEMMGITPYYWVDLKSVRNEIGYSELPFDKCDIESKELLDFLMKCFVKDVDERWSVNELMNVSNCDRE